MVMKVYSPFLKAPGLKASHQMKFSGNVRSLVGACVGGLSPLQKSSRRILQLQPTGRNDFMD